jgi:hypothetical protein
MEYTDQERFDFLERWDLFSYDETRFSLITQDISRKTCPTLREFCNIGLTIEKILEINNLSLTEWLLIPLDLQNWVISKWKEDNLALTEAELIQLENRAQEYWLNLHNSYQEEEDK